MMADHLKSGLSVWAIVAIVCNSVVGVLILLLFAVLYKACKVPSTPPHGEEPAFFPVLQHRNAEGRYTLVAP